MMDLISASLWSPYLAGIGIGILLALSMLLSNRPLGCSSAFVGVAGMIEGVVRGRTAVAEKPYFKEFPFRIEWQWMLVLGIVIGAFLSSLSSGTFAVNWIPSGFAATFGDNPALRIGTALIGGILVGIGARWGWGCTSGHGISGISQLSLTSFVAVACMFVAGIGTALFIYGVW